MFYRLISLGMKSAISSSYRDNFDPEISPISLMDRLRNFVSSLLRWLPKLVGDPRTLTVIINPTNNYFLENMEKFEPVFQQLTDDESKNKLIELLLFKIFGPTKVSLSLNNDEFWSQRKKIETSRQEDNIKVEHFHSRLSLFDLSPYGYDLKLFFATNGIYVDFILQQYNYNDAVKVSSGDIVIDAGACWGDTALYFASLGARDVYAFEFIPSNLEVLEKNISLNSRYADRIHIVNSPVWNTSDIELSYRDLGPSSIVGEAGQYDGNTSTLSIDDLVERNQLPSIDFIKMDVEGAELNALRGAQATIKRFKPKLAISVYHKPDDMIVIPEFIASLNPDYLFYLDYYTIVGREIVLYAIDKNQV